MRNPFKNLEPAVFWRRSFFTLVWSVAVTAVVGAMSYRYYDHHKREDESIIALQRQMMDVVTYLNNHIQAGTLPH